MRVINIQNFNVSILRKKKLTYIYIYNNNFFCIFKINVLIGIINNSFLKIAGSDTQVQKISFFIRQFHWCTFSKIKFSGKGYKIKKNSKQSLILLFNRSHITIIWWKNIIVKKLKKYKIYIKYDRININIVRTILNIRPVNIFTKKGLRNSRQILKKKKGKK